MRWPQISQLNVKRRNSPRWTTHFYDSLDYGVNRLLSPRAFRSCRTVLTRVAQVIAPDSCVLPSAQTSYFPVPDLSLSLLPSHQIPPTPFTVILSGNYYLLFPTDPNTDKWKFSFSPPKVHDTLLRSKLCKYLFFIFYSLMLWAYPTTWRNCQQSRC